jgi:hypothetical protein
MLRLRSLAVNQRLCMYVCPNSSCVSEVISFSIYLWSETEPTCYCGHCSAYCTSPGWWWWLWSDRWKANWEGKPKYSEKSYPSVTVSTRNHTWPDTGSNPDRRGGKPETNRMSYGADSACLRPLGYRDRRGWLHLKKILEHAVLPSYRNHL